MVAEHHRALFKYALKCVDIIAQRSGKFVLLVFTCFVHALAQHLNVLGVATTHEIYKLGGYLLVFGAVDTTYAGGSALSDVAEETGSTTGLCSIEYALAATAHRVDL